MAKSTGKAASLVEAPAQKHPAPDTVDRTGDTLLQLDGMAELSTLSEGSLRWLRHTRGEDENPPPLFKLGRRLVAWRSDVVLWIESEREAQNGTADTG